MVSGTCNGEHFALQWFLWIQKHQQYWINLVCQTQISNGIDRLYPTDHKYLRTEWWISTQTLETLKTQNCIDIVRKQEPIRSERLMQKEMLSLFHQFPFEYVTLKHKQVGGSNSMNSVFVNPGIVASLLIVVIVSGIFFCNCISIIRYNMLLLHKILIRYRMIVHYQIYR